MFQGFWWYRLSITNVNDSMNDMSIFLSTVSTSFYPLIYSFHRLGMHIRTISFCKHWISPISISKMLLPYFPILCLCGSTRNLVPLQSHRGPQTCLHQAIHSCAGLSFDRLLRLTGRFAKVSVRQRLNLKSICQRLIEGTINTVNRSLCNYTRNQSNTFTAWLEICDRFNGLC